MERTGADMTGEMYISGIDGGDSYYPGAVRFYSDGDALVIISRDGEVLFRRASNEQLDQCVGMMDEVKWPTDDIDTHAAYVRFGDIPTDGISINHATGEHERGLSVYDATWDAANGMWHINLGSALCGAMIAGALSEMPVYLVTGEEIGHGSDGEPVISDATVMRRLTAANDSPLCADYYEVV